ncbi:hypothetical protein DVS28_b0328 (plasmid) [Euzebya pacifica]|uniref:SipW-cognate class signal peptide n=1 Tax=Euzebya pacifica TaxID=1608957 RepID=A0A346Y6K1_9ACTN|nr:hypothetical protein [Euzebya pacifica]AXV10098.1 hypothetical protein DVS28_b0328 [Euzebya pacifica]
MPVPVRIVSAAVAAVVLLAAAVVMVIDATSAAFTDQTSNADNGWTAGTLTITDDDGDVAMFDSTTTTIGPGDTVTNCIAVTRSGTVPAADVILYSDTGSTGALDPFLNVTVERGTGGGFGSCGGFTASGAAVFTGTLEDFLTDHDDVASGITDTDVAVDDTTVYRFAIELDGTTPDAQQGAASTVVAFTWTAQTGS